MVPLTAADGARLDDVSMFGASVTAATSAPTVSLSAVSFINPAPLLPDLAAALLLAVLRLLRMYQGVVAAAGAAAVTFPSLMSLFELRLL